MPVPPNTYYLLDPGLPGRVRIAVAPGKPPADYASPRLARLLAANLAVGAPESTAALPYTLSRAELADTVLEAAAGRAMALADTFWTEVSATWSRAVHTAQAGVDTKNRVLTASGLGAGAGAMAEHSLALHTLREIAAGFLADQLPARLADLYRLPDAQRDALRAQGRTHADRIADAAACRLSPAA